MARSATPINEEILEAIGRDPIAAGSEIGATLAGCILITTWDEGDEFRIGVQPHGLQQDPHLFVLALEEVLASVRRGEGQG